MSKSDVERVLKQLRSQPARPQLVNTLVEVRKRIISSKHGLEEFVRQGGLTPLTELLKQPQPAEVFNVTLSVLGNCTARPSGRHHFTQHGGIHAVLNVVSARAAGRDECVWVRVLEEGILGLASRECWPVVGSYRAQ